MTRPDAAAARRFANLPRLPVDAEGPVFAEPWQAQAFAMAVQLHAAGAFSWSDWAAALSAELRAADARGDPDDGSRYYEHWLAALERLVRERGLAAQDALADRKQAWADAYRRTPHGKPVEL
ncbi:MAG: nitrile hydratase accessory protein [Caulobacterales bacterium]